MGLVLGLKDFKKTFPFFTTQLSTYMGEVYEKMRERITLTLDRDFVRAVDEARGLVPRSRFVEKLLVEAWEDSGVHRKSEENATEVPGYV